MYQSPEQEDGDVRGPKTLARGFLGGRASNKSWKKKPQVLQLGNQSTYGNLSSGGRPLRDGEKGSNTSDKWLQLSDKDEGGNRREMHQEIKMQIVQSRTRTEGSAGGRLSSAKGDKKKKKSPGRA